MAVVNHMFLEANHDENARDAFVLNLKWHINLDLGPGLKKVYEHKAKPAFKKKQGRDFKNRHELRKQMLDEEYFPSVGLNVADGPAPDVGVGRDQD